MFLKTQIVLITAGLSLAAAQQIQIQTFERHVGDAAVAVPADKVMFLAGQLAAGPTAKGAPYSAEAVNESVQLLPDGNRISRRTSTMIYRDSEGRERREETVGSNKSITITDPAAGASYSLDPASKTARKVASFSFSTSGTLRSSSTVITSQYGAAAEAARKAITIQTNGTGVTYFSTSENSTSKTEDLGQRNIEGVIAKGTRTTRTIAAGEIGNDRPIDVVSETWYSDELKATVMTRQNDPRTGETTYRLTNINRAEPAHMLFEIPADYTQQSGNAVR